MLEKVLFKKIELWVLFLIVLFGLVFTIVFGWAVYRHERGGTELGRFGILATKVATLPEVLFSVATAVDPYLVEDSRFEGQSGFQFSYAPGTRPDSPFLLINRHDPVLNVGVSELWDLDAQQLVMSQVWEVDPVWEAMDHKSDLSDVAVDRQNARYSPYHAIALEDGGLVSQYITPLIKADACGRVGVLNARYLFHHSIERDAEGNFWSAAHLEPKTVDIGSSNFLDDGLVQVSPNGKILFEKSITQILIENDMGYLLTGRNDFVADDDPIHLNDIQPVLADTPYFKKGDVFVSLRHQSLVMLYRPATNKLIWKSVGSTSHQHDIDVISDHEISVFDNNTRMQDGRRLVDGSNRFMVFDFATGTFSQKFEDALQAYDVRTPTNGRSELYKDDLIVEESDFGRIFALRADGELDWSFVNRSADGNLYRLTWSRLVPRSVAEKFLAARKEAVCE